MKSALHLPQYILHPAAEPAPWLQTSTDDTFHINTDKNIGLNCTICCMVHVCQIFDVFRTLDLCALACDLNSQECKIYLKF